MNMTSIVIKGFQKYTYDLYDLSRLNIPNELCCNKTRAHLYQECTKNGFQEPLDVKEHYLEKVRNNGAFLRDVPFPFNCCEDIVLEALKNNFKAIQFANSHYQNNEFYVITAVKNNGIALKYASDRLKNYKNIVLTAVNNNYHALQYASKTLRNDIGFIKTIVKSNGLALQYASESLRDNTEVVVSAIICSMNVLVPVNALVQSYEKKVKDFENDISCYVSNRLKISIQNSQFLLRVVRDRDAVYLDLASEEEKNNKEFVLRAVIHNGDSLEYVSERLKNDLEVCVSALYNCKRYDDGRFSAMRFVASKFLYNCRKNISETNDHSTIMHKLTLQLARSDTNQNTSTNKRKILCTPSPEGSDPARTLKAGAGVRLAARRMRAPKRRRYKF